MIMASVTGSGSPCGACKFLRRKCASDCIFAPYFCSEQGPAQFAAIHKVFGASNASKLLSQVQVPERCEAVATIAYEAQARIRDPVYGCVAHIFALQQQVAFLQTQLMQMKAQLVYNTNGNSRYLENNWTGNYITGAGSQNFSNNPTKYMYSISPQSSLDSIENENINIGIREEVQAYKDDDLSFQTNCSKKIIFQNELNELQAVALRMMRN
ncbi:hypothetical protein BVC80_9099g267 [Macleaya cordata]|uniref:LOB domain-containing protein n=1 Tax=Macleaya cordata TaxID=56857 RepID=A0A200PW92_MACCD|nr:hypothetical protein BVC80_9099g267 [Macleaya cordata]